MVRVVVTGIAGRMGEETLLAVRAESGFRVAAGTVRKGGPARDLASRLLLPVEETLEAAVAHGADVVIDFTSPAASVEHAKICARLGVPYVTGTTGLSEEEQAGMEEAARSIPLLHAPNLSVGVHLLLRLVEEAAGILGDPFDVEIVEAHHRQKKDAPSGTALQLAEKVAAVLGRDLSIDGCFGRQGMVGPRRQKEVGVHAIRGGDVVGEHTVLFLGDGERLELTHKASSRSAFAKGAVRGAKWIVGKPAGLYGMQDVVR